MIPLIIITSLLKSCRPYIKKVVTSNISDEEFLFANSIIIAIITFFYCYLYKQYKINNLLNLSTKQFFCLLLLGLITIITSRLFLILNKENGIIQNVFMGKAIGLILAIFIGLVFFNEKLTYKQIFGIIIITLGLFLLKND